jgi:hypothetical protein
MTATAPESDCHASENNHCVPESDCRVPENDCCIPSGLHCAPPSVRRVPSSVYCTPGSVCRTTSSLYRTPPSLCHAPPTNRRTVLRDRNGLSSLCDARSGGQNRPACVRRAVSAAWNGVLDVCESPVSRQCPPPDQHLSARPTSRERLP